MSFKAHRLVVLLSAAVLILSSGLSVAPTVGVNSSSAVAGEASLPLDVYILSLSDVGSYRASNHSMVVEGALQATKVKTIHFSVTSNILDVNVCIIAHLISDWEAYRMLIQWGNNAIIVNTHDEYLPVPSGYTKEEWTDKIADFMLNRWGTWTHLGGYPLSRVWYQNGSKEVWGEQGFKTLMSHIGKGNTTCYPPPGVQPEDRYAEFNIEDALHWYNGWWFPLGNNTHSIANFADANAGNPLKLDDFGENILLGIYVRQYYTPGSVIYFSSNQSTFNFGIYVHLSAWRFFGPSGYEFPGLNDMAMGLVATAAAIWADVGKATYEVYGTHGLGSDETAREAIEKAENQGRTVGLDQARSLLQKAIDAYDAHSYKMAVAYTTQAKTAAENATQPMPIPQLIAGVTIATVTIGAIAYHKIKNKNKKKET